MNSIGRRTLKLAVEALEARENPAGGVITTSFNAAAGLLTIIGDAEPNAVQVYRVNDSTRIVATNGTTLNGQAVFNGVTNVVIDTKAGDDTIDYRSSGIAPLSNITVRGGDGYDKVAVSGDVQNSVLLELGRGDDNLSYSGKARSIRVDGGTGNNNMALQLGAGQFDSVIIDSSERASSNRDVISVSGVGESTRVDNIVARGGSGNDSVSFRYFAVSSLYSHGGAGVADQLFIHGLKLYGQRRIQFEGFESIN